MNVGFGVFWEWFARSSTSARNTRGKSINSGMVINFRCTQHEMNGGKRRRKGGVLATDRYATFRWMAGER